MGRRRNDTYIHTYQLSGGKPKINPDAVDNEKEFSVVETMLYAEMIELCRQLLDKVGHDIPLKCEQSEDLYYQNWYAKIAQKEKERHNADK